MNDKERKHLSKYLSLHLRHRPDRLNLTLEPGGWVLVHDLLNACHQDGKSITTEQLDEIVSQCDKQRFAFNDARDKIRANQGHSVEVDLQLTPVTPPPLLYHGTSTDHLASILKQGIQRLKTPRAFVQRYGDRNASRHASWKGDRSFDHNGDHA